jgi:hypothetical protein
LPGIEPMGSGCRDWKQYLGSMLFIKTPSPSIR